MPTCKEITELATDFAEGHLSEADRERFVSHVAGCSGCASWVRQMEATARAVGGLPAQELPRELQATLQARFDDWARARAGARPAGVVPAGTRGRGRFTLPPALAMGASFGLLVGLARRPAGSPGDWAVAAALALVAAGLAALWRRVTAGFAAVAAASSLLGAFLTGGRGSLDLAGGQECLLIVGGAAGGAAAAAWLVLRHDPGASWRSATGAWAAAGALTAVAALQVTCRTHSSLEHLLTFHVGGLLAVIAAALLAPRFHAGRAAG